MAAKAKQIMITTESHEIVTIRQTGSQIVSNVCPTCGTRFAASDWESASDGLRVRDSHRALEKNDKNSIPGGLNDVYGK